MNKSRGNPLRMIDEISDSDLQRVAGGTDLFKVVQDVTVQKSQTQNAAYTQLNS